MLNLDCWRLVDEYLAIRDSVNLALALRRVRNVEMLNTYCCHFEVVTLTHGEASVMIDMQVGSRYINTTSFGFRHAFLSRSPLQMCARAGFLPEFETFLTHLVDLGLRREFSLTYHYVNAIKTNGVARLCVEFNPLGDISPVRMHTPGRIVELRVITSANLHLLRNAECRCDAVPALVT